MIKHPFYIVSAPDGVEGFNESSAFDTILPLTILEAISGEEFQPGNYYPFSTRDDQIFQISAENIGASLQEIRTFFVGTEEGEDVAEVLDIVANGIQTVEDIPQLLKGRHYAVGLESMQALTAHETAQQTSLPEGAVIRCEFYSCGDPDTPRYYQFFFQGNYYWVEKHLAEQGLNPITKMVMQAKGSTTAPEKSTLAKLRNMLPF